MRKKVKDQKVKKSKVKNDKKQKKEKKQKPLSIFGLLITIIKGIFKSIPKMWKSILIRSAISFFVVTAFSMYSIAVKNEGTGAVRFASGTFWGDAINTGGNEAAFNTMCFIATYALTMIVSRISNGGVKKFFKDIFGTIPWTKECLVGSKGMMGSLMFFTMAFIMSLGIFVNNNLLFITLAITLLFEYASREQGLVSVLSLAFWNDFHRVFRRKKGIQPLNFKYVGMITLSMLLGMVILIFMPVDRARTFSIILTILFLALAILLTYNKVSKKVAKNTVSFVIFALLSYRLTGVVFADNGGWTEGGRSVTTYVGSAGSVGAFITSAVSGIFSVAGGLLGVAIGGLSGSIDIKGNWNYGSEMGAALGEDIAYVGIETAVGIKDLTVDLFTDRSLINATMDNINEEMTDFFDSGFQLTEQVSEWVEENVTTEIALETAEGMVRDINGLISGEYAADWIKEELQAFANDPEAYVNNAIAIIEQGGTLAGEASVAVERFLNNMRNDPRAAYEIIKAISPADSIKNIIDPNKGLGERLINVPFATMDIAEMLVGFGVVNIASETLEQGAKFGVRTAIKETAEESGERITREIIDETTKKVTRNAAEEVGDEGIKKVIKETTKDVGQEAAEASSERVIREGVEEAGDQGSKKVIKETTKDVGQETAEASSERVIREGTEEVGDQGTKKVTKESTKDAGQETAEASSQTGTKKEYDGPDFGEGDNYTRQQGPADTRWMTDNSKKSIQSVADEMGVQVHVRPGNPASRKWLEAGEAVPKPQIIKSKTIKDIDRYIGAPEGSEGLVGYFKPKKPNLDDVPKELHDKVMERFTKRMDEYNKYSHRMLDLEQSGMVKVKDGIVSMAVKDPDTGKTVYRQVAGDVDLFDVTSFDGSPLPQNVKDMAVDKLQRIDTSNVEHRDLLSWDELENYQETYGHKWESIEDQFVGNDFNLDAKNNMISDAATDEGLITFNPTEGTTWNKYNHPPKK